MPVERAGTKNEQYREEFGEEKQDIRVRERGGGVENDK